MKYLLLIIYCSIFFAAPASANVTFDLSGSLTSTSSHFSHVDTLDGFITVKDSAAEAGSDSTDPTDIIAYSFTTGNETWSGTSADFQDGFKFSIAGDGQSLFFENTGSALQSSSGNFYLDIVTNNINPSKWTISDTNFNPIAMALGTMVFNLNTGADVTFNLAGSLTSLSATISPFTLMDEVDGSMTLEESAATAGNDSTDSNDVIVYSFTIGTETWSGTGADFQGVFNFSISEDGQTLFFENAGGGLQSSPGDYYLDIITNNMNPTEWKISDTNFQEIASAIGDMVFNLNASTNATFDLIGSLTTVASTIFSLMDEVDGFITIKGSAAAAGSVSTDPTDVIAYSFTIGTETWSGTGADFLGSFNFSISEDGQTLFFGNAGGGLESTPGRYYLDLITNNMNPTEWIISDDDFNPIAFAVGTMLFTNSGQIFANGFE